MRRLITSIGAAMALCFMLSCSETPTKQMPHNQGINIIPAPLSLVQEEGSFTLNKGTTIYASQEEAKTIADFFALKIRRSTGFPLATSETATGKGIALSIDNTLEVNDEGYTLEVTPQQVTVKGKTAQGLFYGMQSLMQLLPAEIENPALVNGMAWTIPAVTIKDEPRFGWRGIHLDPCRHFMTVEEVKRQLDVLSLFKVNTMHWHLTDDQGWRIEIKKYPKLTEIGSKRIEGEGFEYGGYYTQEEVKEVVQYAADRFITVIPEIELPGHGMAAIAAYPELSCSGIESTPRIIWGVEDVVFCAGKEETFEFLEDVFKEVIELFPSDIIHIGGDECPKSEWKACPLCQKRIREEKLQAKDGHTAEERLQSYFVQRMEKVLAKYGKKIIGWDEILEGGLAPTAMVMSWRGEQGGIAAANMEHYVVMTPQNDGMYLDRFEGDPKIDPVTIGGSATIETVYNYNPTPAVLVEQGKEKYILGVQCNTWSEYMYTNELREYRIFPRILALAEIGWTALDRKDYKDFERRIDNACVRLDAYGINYYIPLPEQMGGSCDFVAFTDKATLAFKTSRPIKVVYTLDGTEPTAESTVYEAPIELTESTTLKIRSVMLSGKMSQVRTITVEKQALAPAKEVAPTQPGLKMDVTYGYFLDVDQLANAKEWKSSVIPSLRELTRVVKTSESMRGVNQYAAIANGYLTIPEDGVYYVSSDNEEVWIDGKLIVNNRGEVKRFSRNDRSVALAKGLHEVKVVFLGHIIGGWPSNWNGGGILLRKSDAEKFSPVTPDMLFH
ncbi:family 20 glycosylhydrolase [Parabacteroides sp. PF5-6]|uniref:family 20 glycosylhydrolase n=1 Tax=Parabacteroides sp. PF5-6 TaxID=1742403 RepID=UPI002404F974|nr:family 20 glycosylhydrolase [Parabacteroides sp. PF5-6]MDF9831743.1 hexosaminidase [Parabacteroides sp. PF5-6]